MSFFSCTCRKQLAALLACTSMAALSLSADDSNALSEDWLLTHNFYIAAVTGPWISNPNVPYGFDYDYSYGGGYFTRSSEDQLLLHNFIISGLNVPASLDVENKTLTVNIAGPLTITSQNLNFPGRTVEIYECDMPTLSTVTDDEGTANSTALFNVRAEQTGEIAIPLNYGEDTMANYWGFDSTYDSAYIQFMTNNAWVLVIKDSEGNVEQYITITYPRFESITEFDAPAYDYIDGNVVREYMVNIMQNDIAFDLQNYNALGLNNSTVKACSNSRGFQISTGINYGLNRFIFHPKDNMQRRDFVDNFEGSTISDDEGNATTFKFTYTGEAQTRYYRTCSHDDSEDHVYNGAAKDFINGYINYDSKTAKHNIDVTHCAWVTDGGTRKTFSNMHIKFEMNGLKDQTTGEFIEKLDSTIINWKNKDCTLDVTIDYPWVSYDNFVYHINGTITPHSNMMFVDHYELCMAPSENLVLNTRSWSSEINIDNTLDASGEPYENGFANATNISTAYTNSSSKIKTTTDTSTVYYNPSDTTSFSIDLDAANLVQRSVGDTYGIYIKAVYQDGTGLSPTFHSIQTQQFYGVVAGIDDLCADAAISVRSQGNELIISGDFANVKVFTPAGKLVYDGNASQIPLSPGLYILNVDGRAFKKLIR
jgi:hypothetical protein